MSAERISVFLIDDEEAIVRHFLDYLEDYDEFDVRAFSTAEDALEALPGVRPQVSIVDMRLPGMNGDEFICRAKEACPECMFLIHSGSVDLRLSAPLEGMGLTDDDLFLKPSDMGRIMERVRLLARGQGA